MEVNPKRINLSGIIERLNEMQSEIQGHIECWEDDADSMKLSFAIDRMLRLNNLFKIKIAITYLESIGKE